MARIRTIKPEFPQSESMGNVSRDARLCFILMWTLADDSGRLRGSSRMLASLLFPYDDDAPAMISTWLGELQSEGCIDVYQIEGSTYIQIAKWLSHQKIDRPSESKIPPADEGSRILANPRESSSLDQGSRIKDQGAQSGRPARAVRTSSPQDIVAGDDVDPTHLKDWLKARKSPLTITAWAGLKAEASKAGITAAEAVRICAIKGWRGFDASWNWKSTEASQQSGLQLIGGV